MTNLPHPGVRFPPPVLFAAGLFAGWLLHRRHPLHLGSPGTHGVAIGAWLLILGAAVLGTIAMLTFVKARTAILPMRPASLLVTTGPYRFTRNPMYLSLTILYFGVTLLLNSAWPLFILPLVHVALFMAVIRREERYLESAFPGEYAEYRRRVRRWV